MTHHNDSAQHGDHAATHGNEGDHEEVLAAAEEELGVDLHVYEEKMHMVPELSRKEKDKLTTLTADLLDHESGSPLREVAMHSLTEETLHDLETKDSDQYKTMADFLEAAREARRLAANVGEVEVAEDGHLINHHSPRD